MKKSGALDSSPAQRYQPQVSPSGGWRNPFSGSSPEKKLSEIPSFESRAGALHSAPYRRQISSWDSATFIYSYDSLVMRTTRSKQNIERQKLSCDARQMFAVRHPEFHRI